MANQSNVITDIIVFQTKGFEVISKMLRLYRDAVVPPDGVIVTYLLCSSVFS